MGKINDVDKIPEIKCSLMMISTCQSTHDELVADLSSLFAVAPNIIADEGQIVYVLCETKHVQAWEIVDVLDIMLSDISLMADGLKRISVKYNTQLLVDVVFYHYARFPALVFEGPTMRLINYLNADICIDPY